MLGHDALGHWALGHPPDATVTTVVVVVSTASYALIASAVTTKINENISPAAYVVAPQGVTDKELQAVSTASFAVTANPVTARFLDPVTTAAFVLALNPTTDQDDEAVTPAAFTVSFNNVPLLWTGQGIDPSFTGGIGHLLYEAAEAKRLAAITRRGPPGFVDLRSPVKFAAFGGPPSAPVAPTTDLAAIAAQRATAQMQAAQALRRRRDAQAILLLAS